jgi:phage tail protein X
MAKLHIASDGERIDQIAFKYFGSTVPVKQILEDNPLLFDKVALNAGDKVIINQVEINPIEDLPTGRGVALW